MQTEPLTRDLILGIYPNTNKNPVTLGWWNGKC